MSLSNEQVIAIADGIRALAVAYAKSADWVSGQLKLWRESPRLRSVDPARLVAAVRDWIDTESRPPMLAQLVTRCGVGAPRGEAPTPQGLPAALTGAAVCHDCQGNRWIEVAVHRQTGGGTRVDVAALKCTCQGGEDPEVTRERWYRQDPTCVIYLALGRPLTWWERGVVVPTVSNSALRYTHQPERLDRHRVSRLRAIEAVEEEPWEDEN
jgi:hypothetical protein